MRRSLDVSSILSSDDLADYDVISDGPRSLESSIADLGHVDGLDIHEPMPLAAAKEKFDTVSLSTEDIQTYVQRAIGSSAASSQRHRDGETRAIRVYVDGVFGPLTAKEALQLRQAKLSFSCVHLMVGVFADDLCERYNSPTPMRHVDRCEVVRHCRWVDEVVADAPWAMEEKFLRAKQIDYVAIDEGSSIDPACDRERLKGYDLVKSLRKAIPTRRTNISAPMERIVDPYPSPESVRGTIKGVSTPLVLGQASSSAAEENTETLAKEPVFEEPKIDEFGIGFGL